MITMERLNVARQVATEEQAERLAQKGFTRTGGTAEAAVAVAEADLAKMGEAMFERLSARLQAQLPTAGTESSDSPAAPVAETPPATPTPEPPKPTRGKKAGDADGTAAGAPDSGGGSE